MVNREIIKQLVNTLYNDLSTLSADNPSFYANIYAEKYNDILKELKTLYKDESYIRNLKELVVVKDDSAGLSRLFRNVIISVNQLKAFLEDAP